jgi:hypothetical protein
MRCNTVKSSLVAGVIVHIKFAQELQIRTIQADDMGKLHREEDRIMAYPEKSFTKLCLPENAIEYAFLTQKGPIETINKLKTVRLQLVRAFDICESLSHFLNHETA